MNKLWLDTETFNTIPIKNGTYAYASTCEVMLLTYAIDNGPVKLLDCTRKGYQMPGDFIEVFYDPTFRLCAHNTMFDRNVIKYFWGMEVPVERWYCTMAQALTHSLPGSLGALCDLYRIGEEDAKILDGKKLINLFCKPRPAKMKLRRATRLTHPKEWERFCQYAINDISAMRILSGKMPTWNYRGAELDLWYLDQKKNDRGFAVDLDLAAAAVEAVEAEQDVLKGRTQDLTGGEVESATQRDEMLAHIMEAFGVHLPDMRKDTLERRLEDPDLPEVLKELLIVRLQSSATSVSKYKVLLNGHVGGRLRGTIQFSGAGRTGRAAGRLFQPQNLPRPTQKEKPIREGIAALKARCANLIYSNVTEVVTNSIRGCIVAPPGKKLVVADLANIEGRMLAWLAGEEWKLQAFRDYDSGEGPDLYQLAYSKAFRCSPEEAVDDKRQIGKVMELMLGYEGGVGAYLTGAATYRIDLPRMAKLARPGIPERIWNEAVKYWHYCIKNRRSVYGLSQTVFCVCDSLKRMWREQHPATVTFWKDLQKAVLMAIDTPGDVFPCRKLRVKRDKSWLRIILPSGRSLCYPRIQADEKGKISYEGMNQYSRKWQRLSTYSGKLVENVTQAASRDILYYPLPKIEEAGYLPVLDIHDELLTETPDRKEFSEAGLSKLMVTGVPAWAAGLPLAAKGFEDYRYRKG